VLAGAGLFYVITAAIYRLPVPVQPLKAVSAIAIASRLGPAGIAAAGLEIGVVFTLLGATGLADLLRKVFVNPVVRGVQLGIGLLLAKAAVDLILRKHQLLLGGDWLPVAIGFAAAGMLVLAELRRLPGAALALLAAGLALGVLAGTNRLPELALGPQPLQLALPSPGTFATAFWTLTVPQVGLSLGNSLMATSSAARTYFGERGESVRPGRLGLSMGLANLVVSPLGGMPMCHGAGGMTAHYRMGARSGVGIFVYGLALLAVGLLFGASAANVLGVLPVAVLGGFLLYVGVAHVTLVADLRGEREFLVAATVGALGLATGNITLGVLAGLAVHLAATRLARKERRAEGGSEADQALTTKGG